MSIDFQWVGSLPGIHKGECHGYCWVEDRSQSHTSLDQSCESERHSRCAQHSIACRGGVLPLDHQDHGHKDECADDFSVEGLDSEFEAITVDTVTL